MSLSFPERKACRLLLELKEQKRGAFVFYISVRIIVAVSTSNDVQYIMKKGLEIQFYFKLFGKVVKVPEAFRIRQRSL